MGVSVVDVDGVETNANVVSVKAEPQSSSSVETLGGKIVSEIVDIDLVGGDGITCTSFREEPYSAIGAELDIAIDRHAVQEEVIGEGVVINVSGAIEFSA